MTISVSLGGCLGASAARAGDAIREKAKNEATSNPLEQRILRTSGFVRCIIIQSFQRENCFSGFWEPVLRVFSAILTALERPGPAHFRRHYSILPSLKHGLGLD